MKIKHIVTETELEKHEVISTYENANYLDLEKYMWKPGEDIESILTRIGNVIVISPVCNPVRFIYYISANETNAAKILQIQTGRLGPDEKSALVKHLDYSKKRKGASADALLPEAPPVETEESEQEPESMFELVENSMKVLRTLLYGPLEKRIRKESLRFLIYAMREQYPALIPIINTYRPKMMAEVDEKKLIECGEIYLERKDDAPMVLRMAAEYLRYMIREDKLLSIDLISWLEFREHIIESG